MSNTEFHNDFGQRLDVGDIVGWGHRDGNESVQQVGIVLSLGERKLSTTYSETAARCQWVLGGRKQGYVSSTKASTLFVLDPKTLGQQQYNAIVAAAHDIAIKASIDEEALNAVGAS